MPYKECSIEGCSKEGKAGRGWCWTHYSRWRSHGDPLGGTVRFRGSDPYETVLARSEERPGPMSTPCRIWTGYVMFAKGQPRHGYMNVEGTPKGVHRIALEYKLGRPIKPGLLACHRCDVMTCVNPDHIYEGTRQDNADDRWSVWRGERTYE